MTTPTTTEGVTPNPAAGSSPAAEPQTTPATPTPTPATPSTPGEGTPPATPVVSDAGTTPAQPAPETPAVGAPEKYQAFTLPEGASALGEQFVEQFSDVARKLNLSQESAQQIIDLAPVLQAQTDSMLMDAVKAEHTKWEAALKTDKSLGGEKLTETLATANRVVDAYPGAEKLRALLDDTGFGGHPDVVGFLHWVGSKIVPDTKVVTGDPTGGNRPSDPQSRLAETYADID